MAEDALLGRDSEGSDRTIRMIAAGGARLDELYRGRPELLTTYPLPPQRGDSGIGHREKHG